MKKILFIFIFAFISNFVMAEDIENEDIKLEDIEDEDVGYKNIGITVGLGYGVIGINSPDGGTPINGMKVSCSYNNSFLNNTISFYTEAEYDVAFIDKTPMGLNYEIKLGYNKWLNSYSGIAFLVSDENYFKLYANEDNVYEVFGCVRPGIMYGIKSKFGVFYGQVDVPINYNNMGYKGYDSLIYLDILLKWVSPFGLGIGVKITNYIHGSDWLEKGYQGITVYLNYGYKLFYIDVETEIPKSLEYGSIVTTPKVGVSIPSVPGLSAYLECKISNIGNSYDNDIIVTPTLGVTYSF